jgi:hypothetical protein
MDIYEGNRLGEDGQFIPPSGNIIYINEQPNVTYTYSYEGNYLTDISFTFRDDLTGVTFFDGFMNEMAYSILAFTAAQEEYQAFNFKIRDLFAFMNPENLAFQDYHLTFGDIHVSCDVTYDQSHFHLTPGSAYGFLENGSEAFYDISFRISK